MLRKISILTIAALPFAAHASLVFHDNFDKEKLATPSSGLSQWDIVDKSIDVVGSGSLVGLPVIKYHGDRFLDMDGTSLHHSNGEIVTKNALNLDSAKSVQISYDLNLSEFAPRHGDNGIVMELFTMKHGHLDDVLLHEENHISSTTHDWVHESYSFNMPHLDSRDGVYLSFRGIGKEDWAGVYLDNVNVTAQCVPEPASMAVMGIGLLGLARRRFKK